NRLMELQKDISLACNKSRIGSVCSILADYAITKESPEGSAVRFSGKVMILGRSQYEAPEVDGYVILENAPEVKPGSFAEVRIVNADAYDLHAQIIDKQ
ncbi:hypothetical protein SMA90_26835, partial [Escherichia coli]